MHLDGEFLMTLSVQCVDVLSFKSRMEQHCNMIAAGVRQSNGSCWAHTPGTGETVACSVGFSCNMYYVR